MIPDFTVETVLRLLISSILGGLIGLEREVHGRPAGFRTHLLVSLGSCLFVLSSIHIYRLFGNLHGGGPLGVDPGRIAAQVVTGIGFLGAGAIIREKASVRGLTTAACLWVAAAIGLASGLGMYLTAVVVTTISLISLMLLKTLEKNLRRDSYGHIKIWSRALPGQKEQIEKLLTDNNLKVVGLCLEKDVDSGELAYEYEVKYTRQGYASNLADILAASDGVRRIRIE